MGGSRLAKKKRSKFFKCLVLVGWKVCTSSLRAETLHTPPTTAPTGNGENQYPSADCLAWLTTSRGGRQSSEEQTREHRPLDTRQLTNTCVCMFPACPAGESPCWSTHTADWQECLEFCNMPYVYKLSSELPTRKHLEHFWRDKNVATTGRVRWIHLALQNTRAEPPTGRVLTDCELERDRRMKLNKNG